MVRFRLAVAVALLVGGLVGAFEKSSEASQYDPWCLEDYWACVESGEDLSICMCYREMCMGRDCP
jgi:hypothetical protein